MIRITWDRGDGGNRTRNRLNSLKYLENFCSGFLVPSPRPAAGPPLIGGGRFGPGPIWELVINYEASGGGLTQGDR